MRVRINGKVVEFKSMEVMLMIFRTLFRIVIFNPNSKMTFSLSSLPNLKPQTKFTITDQILELESTQGNRVHLFMATLNFLTTTNFPF